jgi:hypothetical protein
MIGGAVPLTVTFKDQTINGNRVGERTALTLMHTNQPLVHAYEERFLAQKTKALHQDIKSSLNNIQKEIDGALDHAPSALDSSTFNASKEQIKSLGNSKGVNLNHVPEYNTQRIDGMMDLASDAISSAEANLNRGGDRLAHQVKNETFGPSFFGYKPLKNK